jgi:hypothetical protein
MGVLLKFACDRCPTTVEKPSTKLNREALPEGWRTVEGKELCDKCISDLDAFLRGAKIEYVAVERPFQPAGD